ncbi:MAG: carboxypeptidase-like regulatory domain-containing protein [Candidatus Sericytochromatia bacterium]|nr:carboxypeptidase-like regulatory domain-containing protein [Candidatus Sericytochromatia bacterium]
MLAHPFSRPSRDTLRLKPAGAALAGLVLLRLGLPSWAGETDATLRLRPKHTFDLGNAPPTLPLPGREGLHGRLTDRGGKALAGWEVVVRRPWSPEPEARVRTDAGGLYDLGQSEAGPLLVTVRDPEGEHRAGPLPVAMFREGEDGMRASPRRLDIGGLSGPPLKTWKGLAAPTRLAVTLHPLPASCHGLSGGSVLVAHDRKRVWQISEDGRVRLVADASTQGEIVSAVVRGGAGGNALVVAVQEAFGTELWSQQAPGKVKWRHRTRGQTLLLARGPAGDLWWQTLDGIRTTGHVLDGEGQAVVEVRQAAHATAAGLALPLGAILPIHGIGLLHTGPQGWKMDLPTEIQRLVPGPAGGAWAIGGAVATLVSPRGKVLAQWLLPRPLGQATADSKGNLWAEAGDRMVRLSPSGAKSYTLAGRDKPAITALAATRKHLWLLGRDRRTLARVPLE